MQSPIEALQLSDAVLNDAPPGYQEAIFEFLTMTAVERLLRCSSSPYVWDVGIFAHYFDEEPPERDIVARQSFLDALERKHVGQYIIVNPPEPGALVPIGGPSRYMTTDAFFAWLGGMDNEFAQKTREVLAWLVMCGARKADTIQIKDLTTRVQQLEKKICERDSIIESLQRNIAQILRTFLVQKR